MKSSSFAWAFLVLVANAAACGAESLAPGSAVASAPRLAHPGNFGLELGGRAGLYSLQYDYAVSDQVSVGAGAEVLPPICFDGPCHAPALVAVPLYANVYLSQQESSPFLTAGTTVLLVDGGHALPVLGLGYELRDRKSFTLRLTGYVVPTGGRPFFWAGLTIGHH
jgi:hypothetical protein